MAQEKQLSSYKEIMGKLRHLCSDGVTGTLSMATSENHHASISIKEGKIVGVTYRQFKGPAALESIRKVSAAYCAFSPGALRTSEEESSLPSSKAQHELLGINEIEPAAAAKISNAASKIKSTGIKPIQQC